MDNYDVMRYSCHVLQSLGDKTTERVWCREQVRSFDSDLLRLAVRKLLILDAAEELQDLTVPPGNRLEKLRGDRSGQHSVRINQQWRICFRWTAAGPEDVTIVDYH
jgi:proteic killer suppression protein